MAAGDRQTPRVRYFRELEDAYRGALIDHVAGSQGRQAGLGNMNAIDRTLIVNDIDPESWKRVARKAEYDAAQAQNMNIGWTDVFLVGFLFALRLVGKQAAQL
jgi:hypothetical protein